MLKTKNMRNFQINLLFSQRKNQTRQNRETGLQQQLITPAPVCANMIQTLGHTCRGLGCSIFIETDVKRQWNTLPFKVCSIQQCTEHIQPSTIISKNDSKKCVHFGTTARVIRVKVLFNAKWICPQILCKIWRACERSLSPGKHRQDYASEISCKNFQGVSPGFRREVSIDDTWWSGEIVV